MNCKKIRTLLEEGLLEKNPREKFIESDIQKHLEGCEKCAFLYRAMQETVDILREDGGSISPPESVWSGIQEKLETEEKKQATLARLRERFRSLFPRPALGAALGFTAIGFFFVLIQPFSPSREDVFYALEQNISFLNSLESEGEAPSVYTNTAIETYFL